MTVHTVTTSNLLAKILGNKMNKENKENLFRNANIDTGKCLVKQETWPAEYRKRA